MTLFLDFLKIFKNNGTDNPNDQTSFNSPNRQFGRINQFFSAASGQ